MYPLIDYEDDLIETQNFETLKQKYHFYKNNRNEYHFSEPYLKEYFPEAYERLKKERNTYKKFFCIFCLFNF